MPDPSNRPDFHGASPHHAQRYVPTLTEVIDEGGTSGSATAGLPGRPVAVPAAFGQPAPLRPVIQQADLVEQLVEEVLERLRPEVVRAVREAVGQRRGSGD